MSDDKLIQFTVGGVGSESTTAYMSMPLERYLRVMPPFLMEAVEVTGTGNGDERCYLNGHTWGDGEPIAGDLKNGLVMKCLICDCEARRDWSALNCEGKNDGKR